MRMQGVGIDRRIGAVEQNRTGHTTMAIALAFSPKGTCLLPSPRGRKEGVQGVKVEGDEMARAGEKEDPTALCFLSQLGPISLASLCFMRVKGYSIQ